MAPSYPVREDASPASAMLALRAAHRGKHFSNTDDEEVIGAAIRVARAIVRSSGAVQKLHEWRAADRKARNVHAGGRPAIISDEAALIIMATRALLHGTWLYSSVDDWLSAGLCDSNLELLGLDPSLMPAESGRKVYDRFWHAWQRLLAPLDAEPLYRGSRLSKEEFAFAKAERDAELCEIRRYRRTLLINMLIVASRRVAPRHIRRRNEGIYSVDATCVPMPGAPLTKRSRRVATVADAGWYVREPSKSAYGHDGSSEDGYRRSGGGNTFIWGMELEVVIAAREGVDDETYPLLIHAANWHKPSAAPAKAAVEAFTMLAELAPELKRARVSPDRLYLPNASVEDFHQPMRALGYKFSMDYQRNQLGIQGHYQGALLVEGTFMCPATPQALITASIDHEQKLLDDETYAKRLEARQAYQLRPKEAPSATGQKFMCPATGPNATVACPRKQMHRDAKPAKTILKAQLPAENDTVCTNKSSMTIPHTAGEKYRQDIPYRSPRWFRAYHSPRNTIEGANRRIKSSAEERLGAPENRLARSVTAQALFAATAMIAANVTRVFTWLRKRLKEVVKAIQAELTRPDDEFPSAKSAEQVADIPDEPPPQRATP